MWSEDGEGGNVSHCISAALHLSSMVMLYVFLQTKSDCGLNPMVPSLLYLTFFLGILLVVASQVVFIKL